MEKVGKRYVFDTHGQDSCWCRYDGQECMVIRALTEQEADLYETGPMYLVRFDNGTQIDVFDDELMREVC